MKELIIKGLQEVLGKEIPIIEGGFKEGKRCITDKNIAEIHDMKAIHVREAINKNIKRFKENIDFIDLKDIENFDNNLLVSLNYSKMQISKAEHIYLLSERGYSKLIKIFDTDLAWEVHDILMDNYFAMREIINSNEQLKANLLLKAVESNGAESVIAIRDYTNLRIEEETKPLLDELEKLSPLADKYNIFLDTEGLTDVNTLSKNLAIKGLGRNNFYKYLKGKQMLMKDNQPYQIQVDKNYFVVKPAGAFQIGEDTIQNYKTYITTKGVNKIIDMLIEDQYLAS